MYAAETGIVHTLFEISAEVDNPTAHGWYEKVGDFLLRAIVSRHDHDELSSVCDLGRTEDWGHDERRVWYLRYQVIKFA